jgi:hypothetical protein
MRSWVKRYVPITAVIVASLATGYHYTQAPDAPGGAVSANIWVDTSGGSCADNASLIAYPGNGSECSSLNAAVQAAEPGDIIAVRTGTYASETIAFRSSLQNLSPGCDPYGEWGTATSSNCVKIIPDGDVKFRGLTNNASSIWMKGNVTGTSAGTGSVSAFQSRTYDFHITNTDLIGNPPAGADDDASCGCQSAQFRAARPGVTSNTSQRPDHVIIDGLDVDTLSIYSSSNVLVRNVDIGPMWFDTPTRGSSSGAGPDVPRVWTTSSAGAPTNIVFDGAFFHEMNRTFWCDLNNACHPDGLFVNSATGLTIRNSGFSQIAGEVLFFQNFGQPDNVENVIVQNTWFGCKVNSYPDSPSTARTTCGSGTPFSISECGPGGCVNWLVRYNSWVGIDSASEAEWSSSRFVGNAGRQPSATDAICTANTWTYNGFYTNTGGGNCGATNTNSGSSSPTSLFGNTSPGQEDFHLAGSAGSTVADNLVSPTTSDYALLTDVDGTTRPVGANRDAGIDER